MASSISVLNFDNRPFTRTLTARAIGVNPTDVIRWVYPSNATAQTTAFATYPSNSSATTNQIGTLVISFTGSTYDFKTTGFTLCTLQLSCFGPTTAATTGITFDTFPNIDLTLFVNYERTDSSSYFYRLTSTQPLTASPNLSPYFLNLVSTTYNLTSALSSNFYDAWYSLNGTTTRLTNLTALTGFERNRTPLLSSVQAVLSATSAPGSLSAFWSPHILERSISAVFVPYFLSGDFIGYPRGFFSSRLLFDVINPSLNLQSSPGLRFYGEGHTEAITLSTGLVDSRTTNYLWRLANSTTRYPLFSALLTQPLSSMYNPLTGRISNFTTLTSVFVVLTSQIGEYPNIPISLHLTNSLFLTSDPFYYFDDNTGQPTPYPYYISTTNISGNEITPRNKFKESIQILPYNPIEFSFTPGIDSVIYLPINGSRKDYTAVLQTSLLEPQSLSACFGKYGLIWNWMSFMNCDLFPSQFIGKPTNWLSVSCTSTFPKTWEQEPALSADLFSNNPASCSAVNMTWLLSTYQTRHTEFQTPKTINNFDFSLAIEEEGGLQYLGTDDRVGITLSKFADTNVLLSATQTVQCFISAQFTTAARNLNYRNDWQRKNTSFNQAYNITSVAPARASIYTSNRFVLTGTEVKFQNLFTKVDSITSVTIDLDDSNVIYLTGDNITKDFTATYNTLGLKSVKVSFSSPYEREPSIAEFPNIIQVLDVYDQVSPSEYRSSTTSLTLPWPNKPQIGSNDWVVEDNINILFERFFENFNYLESRGRIYPGTYSDYFGYLGVPPTVTSETTACEAWTWEDLDCFNSPLIYDVTWRDVLSAVDPVDANGKFVNQGCATWQINECTSRQINPICYGLYDVEWSWRARKRGNSLTPITWKQTQCKKSAGEYPKKWLFQPALEQTFVVCNEGRWHVNIPEIDTYYDPIANPIVQSRCIYLGVASRNNVLYLVQKNQLKLLDDTREATFFDFEDTVDGVLGFSDIRNVCLDTAGKIYILDGTLSQVSVYTYERDTPGSNFKLFTLWGGFGTAASNTKFSSPNDIHLDQLENVWVTDTGNGCVKHYSNTGSWINTIIDDELKKEIPLSTAVDSQNNVHILTKQSIRVYNYRGEFLSSYSYKNETTNEPIKINTSYNREVIYLATKTQVLKYFRNGVFYGYIINGKENVTNITGLFQDEYRNLLITMNDKVLKYPDVMTIKRLKGTLPNNFWNLEDILIHKEEYIQNWVYTKSFQRLWDNIEIFRNTIFFENSFCKGYRPPIHGKEKMIIGQNEIVTSTVINRVLGYLWDNFTTLLDYFDPSCEEPI